MSEMNIEFFSESLIRHVSFKMYIPDGKSTKELKTVFALHGYTGIAGNFIPYPLMDKYNFAVVSPNGENAFYLDGLSTGHKFCTFTGEELTMYLRKTFHLANNAEDTYIAGISMGGFGAIHTALKYPQNFGKVGALSPALIVNDIMGMKEGESNEKGNYFYYRECFGDLNKLSESENNPEYLAKKLKQSNAKIPDMYICCGTEDSLLENNREFHNFLKNENIHHEYHESKGIHDNVFWDEYTPKIIKWMFE